jgi:hypothetical protein
MLLLYKVKEKCVGMQEKINCDLHTATIHSKIRFLKSVFPLLAHHAI